MLGMKRNLSGASTGSPKDLTVWWFSNVYNCLHVDKWFALISKGPCSPFCNFVVSPRYNVILVKQFLGTVAACVFGCDRLYHTLYYFCVVGFLSKVVFIIFTGLELVLQKTAGKYCVGDEVSLYISNQRLHVAPLSGDDG